MSVSEVDYRELEDSSDSGAKLLSQNLDLLKHVQVNLEIKVGYATLSVADLFQLKAGSVLSLDKKVEEPVEILLNGQAVAAGYLAVSGENLGVRVTEIRNENAQITNE